MNTIVLNIYDVFKSNCYLNKYYLYVAQIPPIKTALKLAMFNQNSALMHLCAMALKTVYIIKSGYPRNHTIDYLLANMDDLNEANKATVSIRFMFPMSLRKYIRSAYEYSSKIREVKHKQIKAPSLVAVAVQITTNNLDRLSITLVVSIRLNASERNTD